MGSLRGGWAKGDFCNCFVLRRQVGMVSGWVTNDGCLQSKGLALNTDSMFFYTERCPSSRLVQSSSTSCTSRLVKLIKFDTDNFSEC